MRKGIFESEEEFVYMVCEFCNDKSPRDCVGCDFRNKLVIAKQKGYIKQNPVEKAEEAIKFFQCRSLTLEKLINVTKDIRDGFNYLKKQLEEKTNA